MSFQLPQTDYLDRTSVGFRAARAPSESAALT